MLAVTAPVVANHKPPRDLDIEQRERPESRAPQDRGPDPVSSFKAFEGFPEGV